MALCVPDSKRHRVLKVINKPVPFVLAFLSFERKALVSTHDYHPVCHTVVAQYLLEGRSRDQAGVKQDDSLRREGVQYSELSRTINVITSFTGLIARAILS
jgi:hypothetical protein